MGRLRFGSVGTAFAVLLASGCSLLPSVGTPSFQAATLAAPDAWSFTEVTLRPSVQQALYARDVFNFYADQTGPGGALNQLPTPSGGTVDFEKDVLPHLDGEVAYVLSGSPDEPQGVLLIHTNDVETVLRLDVENPATKLTRDARGALRYTNGSVLAAGYKNWVVSTNDDAMLTQTLDRIDGKGGPTLATQPRYRSAVERLKGDYLGYGYLDVSFLLDSSTFRSLEVASSNLLSTRGRLAYSLAFGAGPDGGTRALDMRSEFIAESAPPPMPRDRGDALSAMDRLPINNAIAISGSSMGQVAQTVDALSADVVPGEARTLVHSFEGPFATGVSPELGSRKFPASLFFLGHLSADMDAAGVQDLVSMLLGDDDTTQHEVVTDAEGEWTAINVVSASDDLAQVQQQLLASDRTYQSVRPALTQDGTNAYVNVGALLTWSRGQGATSEELAVLSQLRAVGTSTHTEAQGDAHGRILVIIGS